MSDRTPYEAQRDAARHTISRAQEGPILAPSKGATVYDARLVASNLAIAEAILTLAEAVRPAPVEVSVKVDIDEDQIVRSVRDAVEGGAA